MRISYTLSFNNSENNKYMCCVFESSIILITKSQTFLLEKYFSLFCSLFYFLFLNFFVITRGIFILTFLYMYYISNILKKEERKGVTYPYIL